MSDRGNFEYLIDIKEAITRIESYTSQMTYRTFLKDKKTQDATIRNIQIIGEAVKGITLSLKKKYKGIEWKSIAGMRDKIIHFYFGVNFDIVWDVVKNKLPGLKKKIVKIIRDIEE